MTLEAFFIVVQVGILPYQLIFSNTLKLFFSLMIFLALYLQNLASSIKQVFLVFIDIFPVCDFLCQMSQLYMAHLVQFTCDHLWGESI